MCPETILDDKTDQNNFLVEGLVASLDRPLSGGRRLVCPLVRDFKATVLKAPTGLEIIQAGIEANKDVEHLKKMFRIKRIAFRPRRSGEK